MQSTRNAKSCGFTVRSLLNYFYCWKFTLYFDGLDCLKYASRLEKVEVWTWNLGWLCSSGGAQLIPQVTCVYVVQPLLLLALGSRPESVWCSMWCRGHPWISCPQGWPQAVLVRRVCVGTAGSPAALVPQPVHTGMPQGVPRSCKVRREVPEWGKIYV